MSVNNSRDELRHFDPSVITTRTAGGIQYRLQAGYPIIDTDQKTSEVKEKYLLRSIDAEAFYNESFPPPVIRNGTALLPSGRRLPGNGAFITKKITFTPHSNELCWDPFGSYTKSTTDPSYDTLCLAEITYGPHLQEDEDDERDPKDPETFLERSINMGGQWLSLPPQKVKLLDGDVEGKTCAGAAGMNAAGNQVVQNGVGVAATDVVDGNGGTTASPILDDIPPTYNETDGYDNVCVDDQGQPSVCPPEQEGNAPSGATEGEVESAKDYELPVLLPIQTIEYSFKWPMALRPNFNKMFAYVGKVNRDRHPLFWNAKRETVLFTGVSASQRFVWTAAGPAAQPWDVELRFSQRIIHDCGRTYGWNHVITRDGVWKRLLRANGQPLHYSFRIKNLFN